MAIKGTVGLFDVGVDDAWIRRFYKRDENGQFLRDENQNAIVKRTAFVPAKIDVWAKDEYVSLTLAQARKARKMLDKAIRKAEKSEEKLLNG